MTDLPSFTSTWLWLGIGIVFVLWLGWYLWPVSLVEGMGNLPTQPRCPNLLIQKDGKFYLHNTNLATVPGVNPVVFDTLEDYTQFLEWQQAAGIRCPVLYLQHSYDAQGNRVYKARPSVTEPEGGLPPVPLPLKFETDPSAVGPVQTELLVDATRSDPPYNQGGYPAFDQSSYYVGAITPLDMIKNSDHNMLYSDNPMDPNWGGEEYTRALLDAGYYKGNEVSIAVP